MWYLAYINEEEFHLKATKVLPPGARMSGRVGGVGSKYSHDEAKTQGGMGKTKKIKTVAHDMSEAVFLDDRDWSKKPMKMQELQEKLMRALADAGGGAKTQLQLLDKERSGLNNASLQLARTKTQYQKQLRQCDPQDADEIKDSKSDLVKIKARILQNDQQLENLEERYKMERLRVDAECARIQQRNTSVDKVLGTQRGRHHDEKEEEEANLSRNFGMGDGEESGHDNEEWEEAVVEEEEEGEEEV